MTVAEARPVIDAHQDALPAELRGKIYGTSFTTQPRATAQDLAAA